MVWIGTGYPADRYEEIRSGIISDVEKMAELKDMADGFLTIQYILKDGKPYYLETMRRCLGNLHFKCISRDCGLNLYELFVAAEAGEDCSGLLNQIKPTGLLSGFMGLYASENGTFDSVEIDEKFDKFIFEKMLLVKEGYVIDDYLNDKLGMVWFSFNNSEERNWFINNRLDLVNVITTKEE